MPIMFLTREELQELSGLKRPSTIIRFLDQQKIRYLVGVDGWPRVLREVIVERLGGSAPPPKREPKLRLSDPEPKPLPPKIDGKKSR